MRNGLAIVPRNTPNRNVCQYLALTPFPPFHGFGQSFTDVENEAALKLLLLEAGGTTKVIETALR